MLDIFTDFGRAALGVVTGTAALALGFVTVKEIVHHYKTPKSGRPEFFTKLRCHANNGLK